MTYDPKAFSRTPVPFQMMGETFEYKFLPNIHLNSTLSDVLELFINLVQLNVDQKSIDPREGVLPEQIMDKITQIMTSRVYAVIKDVLKYQNDRTVTIEELFNQTSTLEIAKFVSIIMNDEEIPQAVEALLDGLGKLKERLGKRIPLLTQSFMQSGSVNSDEAPNT